MFIIAPAEQNIIIFNYHFCLCYSKAFRIAPTGQNIVRKIIVMSIIAPAGQNIKKIFLAIEAFKCFASLKQ